LEVKESKKTAKMHFYLYYVLLVKNNKNDGLTVIL